MLHVAVSKKVKIEYMTYEQVKHVVEMFQRKEYVPEGFQKLEGFITVVDSAIKPERVIMAHAKGGMVEFTKDDVLIVRDDEVYPCSIELFNEKYEDYVEKTTLSFGEAIELAKNKGKKCSRYGWNGKDMFFVYLPGYPNGIGANEVTAKVYKVEEGTELKFRPYLQLKTAQNDIAMWTPSVSDILAEDWFIVE